MKDFLEVKEGVYLPELLVDISCNQDVNGEHRLLETIIKNSPPKSHIFDVGARNSKFPTFSNTHTFHLFDPQFIYEPGVNYDKAIINENALNSTTYTLDDYCKNIDTIELIKIDTDGYDIEVLKGGKETIKKTKFIQIEYDIFYLFHKQDVNDIYEILDGRQIYKITSFGLKKVNKIKEDYIYSNFLFCKEEDVINYEPYELNLEFFQQIFWEAQPDYIKYCWENSSGMFSKYPNFNKRDFVVNYLSNYLPGFVDSLLTKDMEV